MGNPGGMTVRQFRNLAEAVIRALPTDLNPTTTQGWVESPDPTVLGNAIRTALMPTGNSIYIVFVDYAMSAKDAVKAGRYDDLDPNITSPNFPTGRKGTAEITVELINFRATLLLEEAIRKIEGMVGYRPADLQELLAFGAQNQNVQRHNSIISVAPESSWCHPTGRRFFPELCGGMGGRSLLSRYVKDYCGDNCCFPVVRK